MEDEAAFLRAIADQPEDDAPRLVYADWLEERNDPRAEYLRVEHRGRANPAAERERLDALRARLDPAWLRAVHDYHLWPDWAVVLQARLCSQTEAAAAIQDALGVTEAEALDLARRLVVELRRGLSYWEAHRLREKCGYQLLITVEYRPGDF